MFSNRYYRQRSAARAIVLKDYRRAIKHLTELNHEVPNQVQTLYLLALSHERLKLSEEAIALLQQALAIEPQHYDSLQLMTRVLITCKREAQAVAFVQRALAVLPSPRSPWWVRVLGALKLRFLCPQSESQFFEFWAHAFLKQQRVANSCQRTGDDFKY